MSEFKVQIQQGIPLELPQPKPYDTSINHAPKRREILTEEEKKLALKNALRYFEPKFHAELIKEFKEELENNEELEKIFISYVKFYNKYKNHYKNNPMHIKKLLDYLELIEKIK